MRSDISYLHFTPCLLFLLMPFLLCAQNENKTESKWERPFREAPVFPAHIPEEKSEEMLLESDSLSYYVSPEVRALSDSLKNSVDNDALTSKGAPSIVLRHHVESPRSSGVYVPKPPKAPVDTTNMNWWYLLKHGRLKLMDPKVEWPPFLGFIVKMYNGFYRIFNSYDPVYIRPFPEDGIIRIVSDNWNDQYVIDLSEETQIGLNSRPFYTVGLNLSYLGIGYTYSLDLSNIIGNRPDNHISHRFGLTTQCFEIDYKYNSSKDGSRVVSLTGIPSGLKLNRHFPGVEMRTWTLAGYYFFNNKKYCQAAATGFSRQQLKSAGSLITGLSYTSSNTYFDFEQLPDDLLPYIKNTEYLQYRFRYRNAALLMGYAHNFVLHKNFLLNMTLVPGLGLNHCYETSQAKDRYMVAFSGFTGASMIYNIRRFFLGADARLNLVFYRTSSYALLSSVLNFSLSAGSRF